MSASSSPIALLHRCLCSFSRSKGKTARVYPGFINMKHLGVLPLPPVRDTSPSHGYTLAVCRRYPFIHLGDERQSGVKFFVWVNNATGESASDGIMVISALFHLTFIFYLSFLKYGYLTKCIRLTKLSVFYLCCQFQRRFIFLAKYRRQRKPMCTICCSHVAVSNGMFNKIQWTKVPCGGLSSSPNFSGLGLHQ